MYNLLKMSSIIEDEWEQNQANPYDISFLNGRIFEYTDEEIEQWIDPGEMVRSVFGILPEQAKAIREDYPAP